jgi:hypothetical protein
LALSPLLQQCLLADGLLALSSFTEAAGFVGVAAVTSAGQAVTFSCAAVDQ